MRPYTPDTNKGRVQTDEIHHLTANQNRKNSERQAHAARHAARQDGKHQVEEAVTNAYAEGLVD
ncbi:hypothetical protein [Neptuniibacter sp. QD37_11]|uniref:hypothetical protein n=1 Tax=Neptuniibacter sp. QD37_11 TaxID=3398209 RepID=UPI0039F48FFC